MGFVGMGNYFRPSAPGLSESGIAAALAARGLTDAQARAEVGGSIGIASGLRAIGVSVLADLPVSPPAGFALNGSTNTAWKAAYNRVVGGTGSGKIGEMGDSVTAGVGSNGTGYTNARANRRSRQLAAAMRGAATPVLAFDLGSYGDQGVAQASFTMNDYDPRITGGTDWRVDTDGNRQAPAACFIHPTTNAKTWDFSERAFDKVVIGILDYAAGTVLTFASSNGTCSPASYTTTGAVAPVFITVTVPRGAGTFTMGSGAAQAYVSTRPYDSTQSRIDIINAGTCGMRVQDQLVNTDWSKGFTYMLAEACDLYTVEFGINDMASGVSQSDYLTGLGPAIDTIKAQASVLVKFPHAVQTSTIPDATYQSWNTAAKNLAATKGVAFLSYYDAFGPWSSAYDAANLYDGVHCKGAFYGQQAALDLQCLLAMAA